MNKKKSFLNADDEIELFHSRDFWSDNGPLIDAINLSLSPHSDMYYSKLCPIFSYELQKFESLNLFSSVLLRDGALFLIDFFIKNPSPTGLRTKILINKNLASLAPESWKENLLFYGYEALSQNVGDKAFYITNLENYDNTYLETAKQDIQELREAGKKEIIIIASLFSSLDKKHRADLPALIANFSREVSDGINDTNISFRSISDIELTNCKGFCFKFNRNILLWCGDSYLQQLFLTNGIVPFNKNEKNDLSSEKVQLSLNHNMTIYHEASTDNLVQGKLWQFVNNMNISTKSLNNIDQINGNLEDFISTDIQALATEFIDHLSDPISKDNFFFVGPKN